MSLGHSTSRTDYGDPPCEALATTTTGIPQSASPRRRAALRRSRDICEDAPIPCDALASSARRKREFRPRHARAHRRLWARSNHRDTCGAPPSAFFVLSLDNVGFLFSFVRRHRPGTELRPLAHQLVSSQHPPRGRANRRTTRIGPRMFAAPEPARGTNLLTKEMRPRATLTHRLATTTSQPATPADSSARRIAEHGSPAHPSARRTAERAKGGHRSAWETTEQANLATR